MQRSTTRDAATRAGVMITRGTLQGADDSKRLQEVAFNGLHEEIKDAVEHWIPYAFSHVPLPPDAKGAAEVLALSLGGARSHPVVIAVADRRHRPKNLKPGESAHHDDQGQHVHLTRAGINATGKKVTLTAGDKPATKDFELNEQLKGLAARLSQVEDSHHAMHAVLSKGMENVEQLVQGLAPLNVATQVKAVLSGQPSGLDAAKAFAEGRLKGYLQNALQRGLKAFLDPSRLLGMGSLLSGGIEDLIARIEAQVAGLIANNPVIGAVDDLVEELAALNASGAPAGAIAAKAASLAAQIDELTRMNPVVGEISRLRGALQRLTDQAGPALNFLEPQKRLAQGQTKSMRFGGPG